ncbi:Zinc finger C2HC domain-containing protein 1C [Podochytrium sp. JEL0797]|nr:Zinc finger C2HC domain-containing protein 1C [Podochytrium sp. JEL0797]
MASTSSTHTNASNPQQPPPPTKQNQQSLSFMMTDSNLPLPHSPQQLPSGNKLPPISKPVVESMSATPAVVGAEIAARENKKIAVKSVVRMREFQIGGSLDANPMRSTNAAIPHPPPPPRSLHKIEGYGDQQQHEDHNLAIVSNQRSLMEASLDVQDKVRRLQDRVKRKMVVPHLMDGVTLTDKPIPVPKKNWRTKHDTFLRMVRANRTPGDADPSTPALPDPDYIQCDHCGRRFNETAAERHIPICANTKHRPKPMMGKGGAGGAAAAAVAQDEARMRKRLDFKPPVPKARKSPEKTTRK